jgi:hypothetical protein
VRRQVVDVDDGFDDPGVTRQVRKTPAAGDYDPRCGAVGGQELQAMPAHQAGGAEERYAVCGWGHGEPGFGRQGMAHR